MHTRTRAHTHTRIHAHAQVRHAYERADFEVRKEKRPDYYALIGCLSVASESEIKSAYKKRALEWHPDKWMDQPLEVCTNVGTIVTSYSFRNCFQNHSK